MSSPSTAKLMMDGDRPFVVSGPNDQTPQYLHSEDRMSVFTPPTDDLAGILIAANAAKEAGGGIVKLKPITYDIGPNSIPLYNKVKYEGSGYDLFFLNNIVDDPWVDAQSGTIIKGDGTNIGFAGNNIDGAAVPPGVFNRLTLVDIEISNLAITNCRDGIRVGGRKYPGAAFSKFYNLHITDCRRWGAHFENMIHCEYDRMYGTGNGIDASWNTIGGGVQWETSIFGYANCHVGQVVFSAPVNLLARVLEIKGSNDEGGASGGLATTNFLQGNRFNNPNFTPQACVANGTDLISVADYTKFQKDLPVVFTAVGTSNLVVNRVYSVKEVLNSGHIKVCVQPGDPALVVTAGNLTVDHRGFPPLMVFVDYATTNVHLGVVHTLDLEAGGTAKAYFSRMVPAIISFSHIARDASTIVDLVFRNTFATMTTNEAVIIDAQNASGLLVNGLVRPALDAFNKFPFFGIEDGRVGLQITGNRIADEDGKRMLSLINKAPGNGDFTYPAQPFGMRQGFSNNTARSWNNGGNIAGYGCFTAAAPGVWTWDANPGAEMQGYREVFKNASKTAGATLTITLGAAAGTFDGLTGGASAGKSIVLQPCQGSTPGGVLAIVCSRTAANTYEWSVEYLHNGAMV